MFSAEFAIETVYFLTVLAGMIAFQHLAIGRNPNYRDNELLRRALGIGTVLYLAGGWVHFTGGSWLTWGIGVVFFAAAGMALIFTRWWDRQNKPALGRAEGRRDEQEREITGAG